MNPVQKRLKILIVDDSRIFRSAIQQGLSDEKSIEVVGSVWNGVKAMEFIESTPPDIVTLDVQMPGMDGLQTLRAIQNINAFRPAKKQIGVIMLSSYTQKGAELTVRALEMGAFDFIPKPEGGDLAGNMQNLCRQLVTKIRQYTERTLPDPLAAKQQLHASICRSKEIKTVAAGVDAILIGVSTGGPKALVDILPPLCGQVEVPILIVQHMPPTFTESLARSLDDKCNYMVREGCDNEIVLQRHAYIAPGGRHMELTTGQDERYARIRIHDNPPQKGCRPSVDILFASAAKVYGRNIIAVILTGMGTDGTLGAGILKEKGARIIAQDEESSVVWGMPGSVIDAGLADNVLPLKEIPAAIMVMMNRQGKAAAP